MERIFEIASKIDTPLALGGLFAAIVFFIFRRVLNMKVFPVLGTASSQRIILVIVERLFVLALIAMILGFVAYVVSALTMVRTRDSEHPRSERASVEIPPEPMVTSQNFDRGIGDSGSCTEKNVHRTFDLCIEPGYAVTDWDEQVVSQRNSSHAIERQPASPNCVSLTLGYSDYGRGPLGDCKGNGNIQMRVTVRGRRQ